MAATKKSHSKSDPDQYTDPELRDRIKEQILVGNKGGKPGQWSARKAQMVATEYEHRGGGYKHERTEAQEHLHEWTEEKWTTSDGKPAQRNDVTKRYLPEKAWEQLSDSEKKATDKKKVRGSKAGKQFVPNTQKAAAARSSAESKAEPTPKHTPAKKSAAKKSAAKTSATKKSPARKKTARS